MSESQSFTSLSDLIDSHLSKQDVKASTSSRYLGRGFNNVLNSSASETTIPSKPRFMIPGLKIKPKNESMSDISTVPITNIEKPISKQVEAKVETSEVDEDFIDLMKCMQIPYKPPPPKLSITPEIEDIDLEIGLTVNFEETESEKKVKLPCLLDGFVRTPKIKRKSKKRVSNIGKVICMKYLEMQEPYFEPVVESKIEAFKFDTPSPDDIIRATLKRPLTVTPRIFK